MFDRICVRIDLYSKFKRMYMNIEFLFYGLLSFLLN